MRPGHLIPSSQAAQSIDLLKVESPHEHRSMGLLNHPQRPRQSSGAVSGEGRLLQLGSDLFFIGAVFRAFPVAPDESTNYAAEIDRINGRACRVSHTA